MGGIPVQLHWLPWAWHLRAPRVTLHCCRRITAPPLDLTLPCHFPALVAAYLLLACTIPMPPWLFHLPPLPVLLPPHLLQQRCSSLIPSRMQRLTWMLWESSGSTFGTQIFHPAFGTVRWLLPHPTLRPAASGRVSFVLWSKTASFVFCSRIKASFTAVVDLRCWPPLLLTFVPILLIMHSPPSFQYSSSLRALTSQFWHSTLVLMALFWKWHAVRWWYLLSCLSCFSCVHCTVATWTFGAVPNPAQVSGNDVNWDEQISHTTMSSSSRSLIAKRNPPSPLLEFLRRLRLTMTTLVLFGAPHLIVV